MPGFASILNPGQNVPDDKAIEVFYSTDTSNLGLQLRDKTTDDDDSPLMFHSTSNEPAGNLVNPSQLTSTVMKSVNAVFGFTKQKATDSKKLDISLVSPVFEMVASTEDTNKTIASCCSDDKAWIYYLR